MDPIFLPLYLDGSMVSFLYNIGIALTANVNIRKINRKTQEKISFDTPLSELTKDVCGRYIQGNSRVEVTNEIMLEREIILIDSFIKIRKMLHDANMIRQIRNAQDFRMVKSGQYVEFNSQFDYDPKIKYLEEMVNLLEIQLATDVLSGKSKIDKLKDSNEMVSIDILKNQLKRIKESQCHKLHSSGILDGNRKVILSIQNDNVLDHIEHLYNNNLTVLGKVSRICSNKEIEGRIYNQNAINTIENYIKENCELCNMVMKDLHNSVKSFKENNIEIIEVIPIAMYV